MPKQAHIMHNYLEHWCILIKFASLQRGKHQHAPIMANFLLYKYKFEKTTERSLFSTVDGESVTGSLLSKRLDNALKSAYVSSRTNQLNLYATVRNRKGERERVSLKSMLTPF